MTLRLASLPALAADAELTAAQFRAISTIARDVAGIQLRAGKEGLVRSRLARRLRTLAVPSYDAYLERVAGDPRELAEMVDLLTTNKTSFFRERAHFDFLRDALLPHWRAHPAEPVRLWSAGCSSGEEAYTLAMVLREAFPDIERRDVRILATDLSHRVLAQAREGVYGDAAVADVPPALLHRHFTRVAAPSGAQGAGAWSAGPGLRQLVTFAPLNLMGAWPMRGPFHAILCRNVMIYFDKPTQQRLVERYHALLAPGGHLFVGHSESLSALTHAFAYVQPALYRR
ncbi:MAG TPA: protein-glutamate O-methyltransferase CheR [Gemmatirosa sp.]|nr:protein-glutamate O-methyltransferase CheR [Gemmatirosa sp.]